VDINDQIKGTADLSQHLLIDDDLKEEALFKKKKKNKRYVKDEKAVTKNMAINESEDLISEEGDTRSIIDEDDHMDVEVERRTS
jgi:hypothetical protein